MKTAAAPYGRIGLVFALASLGTGSGQVAFGQSAADRTLDERLQRYERFLNLRPLVRGGTILAYWAPDGHTFWYEDPEEPGQGWLVDPIANTHVRDQRAGELEPPPAQRTSFGPRLGRAWNETGERWAEADGGGLRVGGSALETRALQEPRNEVVWQLEAGAWNGPWLSAVREDLSGIYHLEIPDYSSALPQTTRVPYMKSGHVAPVRGAFLFNVETGEQLALELGSRRTDRYVFAVGWIGSEALFLVMTRDCKQLQLVARDPAAEKSRVVLTEQRETFMGGLDFILGGWRERITLLPDEDRFLWLSDEDDWQHIYVYSLDGTREGRLSSGAFPVERVLTVGAGRVWFLAGTEDRPYDRQLHAVGLDGSDQRRLTGTPGVHEISFSPSMAFFLDTHSDVDRAPATELRRSSDGALVRELARAETAGLKRVGWIAPEPFTVLADDGETTLYGVLYRPADFDPERTYPVIDYIYAGPWLAVVQHEFFPSLGMARRAHALAQMGYVVFMLDGRGTPGRSKSFQDASFGRIGEIEIPDHVAALAQLAERHAFIDAKRAGVVGASWGGYFALRAMFTAPEVFAAGVSIAPGDLTEAQPINEPYMGLPQDNPDGYRRGSVLFGAENLRGALLIAHGTADRNAPVSTTMRVVAALVQAQKPHRTIILPDQAHAFSGPSATFFQESMLRFLEEHLRP